MGRTRFSGPVYGAKCLLFGASPSTLSTGSGNGVSNGLFAGTIVPPGEDWYACELTAFRGSTGSSAAAFSVLDDSSVVATVTLTSTTAAANGLTVITPEAGEKEGARIRSGSTVHLAYSNSSGQAVMTNVTVAVFGYRRFVDSSRAE